MSAMGDPRNITIVFRASPSLRNLEERADLVLEFRLEKRVYDTLWHVSSVLRFPLRHLLFFHDGRRLIPDGNPSIRWRDVSRVLEDPHVYFCQRRGRRALADLCEVELVELRRSVCTYITNQGVNKNPSRYQIKELEFMVVASVLIMIQEGEKSCNQALEKAVWRYAVFSKGIRNPSAEYLQRVISLVQTGVRKTSRKSLVQQQKKRKL